MKRQPEECIGGPEQIWKSSALGKQYLEGVRGAMPLAETQIELMLLLLGQAPRRISRFLDLGCGDGILGHALLNRYPDSHGVFLDFSESMIAAAKEKLAPNALRATFIVQDYGQPEWVDVLPEHQFDAVVSGLSIHHQPDERKKAIYRTIFDLLAPGGLFLNLEHVASASPWGEKIFDQYFIESLCRYHQRIGSKKTPEEIAQEYYHRPDKAANMLAPVEDQCQWLQAIGFANTDCYFKLLEISLFGGMKPLNR
jgi:ubiquinone/menaquinone biosynthesis C-methylase UbiE